MNPIDWLDGVTAPERAHWESKPQSEKDWWYVNTKPEERGGILRTEISANAARNEFLHLPEPKRAEILKRSSEAADAARARIRQREAARNNEGSRNFAIKEPPDMAVRSPEKTEQARRITQIGLLLVGILGLFVHAFSLLGIILLLGCFELWCRCRRKTKSWYGVIGLALFGFLVLKLIVYILAVVVGHGFVSLAKTISA